MPSGWIRLIMSSHAVEPVLSDQFYYTQLYIFVVFSIWLPFQHMVSFDKYLKNRYRPISTKFA